MGGSAGDRFKNKNDWNVDGYDPNTIQELMRQGSIRTNPYATQPFDANKDPFSYLVDTPQVDLNAFGSNPFTLNRQQMAGDTSAIRSLAQNQQAEAQKFYDDDRESRSNSRQALADSLATQSQDYFKQGLPALEETLNSQHLLNGSGLGQEIARQQGTLATNIANQVGLQGVDDINRSSDLRLGALQAQQGLTQSALSRGFSLSDFARQAQVAKAIGATAAPQVGNGKGSTVSGLGAGAAAGAPLGPWGALAGAAAGGAASGKGRR